VRRLTCIAPFVAYEQIPHAGGQFLFHYLTRMSEHFDVRLLAPGIYGNDAAAAMGPPGVEIHLVPVKPLPSRFAARAGRYVRLSANGLTLGLGELRAFEGDVAARRMVADSDVIEIHISELLPLAPLVRRLNPSAHLVAVEYDVRFQSVCLRAQTATRRRARVLAGVAARRARRGEPALLNRCDAVLTFTEKDVRLLRDLGVRRPIHLLSPYLAVPGEPIGPSSDPNVLFVAAFDRPENAEAAMWFLDAVWPAVVGHHPGAVLVLAGANPPAMLLRRAGDNVRVTGYVDDLDPLYRSSAVAVCPLLRGAGLKFKVPQAMFYGLPVVTTAIGADGILDRSGGSVFGAVCDDPAEMARAIVALLGDPALAADVGRRARKWAGEEYRFDDSVDAILALYRRTA
jgi:glycosyltransferase involved in cell wall biosynthesis